MAKTVKTSMRWTEDAYRFMKEEADAQGIPVAQLVREGSLAWAAWCAGQRSDDPGRTMLAFIERLRRS